MSLQNFRYILRFDFFFAMFRTIRGQRRKKKPEIEQSDYKAVFKGTI